MNFLFEVWTVVLCSSVGIIANSPTIQISYSKRNILYPTPGK